MTSAPPARNDASASAAGLETFTSSRGKTEAAEPNVKSVETAEDVDLAAPNDPLVTMTARRSRAGANGSEPVPAPDEPDTSEEITHQPEDATTDHDDLPVPEQPDADDKAAPGLTEPEFVPEAAMADADEESKHNLSEPDSKAAPADPPGAPRAPESTQDDGADSVEPGTCQACGAGLMRNARFCAMCAWPTKTPVRPAPAAKEAPSPAPESKSDDATVEDGQSETDTLLRTMGPGSGPVVDLLASETDRSGH